MKRAACFLATARAQIAAVHECLDAGALESAEHPNDEMVALLETMDEIRAQLGVVYPEDEPAAVVG